MDTKPEPAPVSLWDQILSEYKDSAQQTRVQEANIIILGQQDGGARSLIARILGKDHADKYEGYAMEYEFVDVKNEADEDSSGRLSLWHIENVGFSDLLQVCLKVENVLNTIILLVVDLTVPHAIIETLDEWTRRLNSHLVSIFAGNPEVRRQADSRILTYLAKFQREQEEKNTKDPHVNASTGLSFVKDNGEAVLGPGTLLTNIGVPLIVVGAKSDQLERVTQASESKAAGPGFDASLPSRAPRQLRNFIQGHMRKWALAHGASLVFTSSHTNTNCSLLVDYINHRAFDFPFEKKEKQLTKGDAIFVPFGTDSLAEISKLPVDQLAPNGFDTHYNAIVKPEPKPVEVVQTQPVLQSLDHQAFLRKLEQQLRLKGRDDPFATKASPTAKKEFAAPTRAKETPGTSIEKDAAKFFAAMITNYNKKK
eukprot:TRINITY_DN82183_c0_g1_i1.p1 TRINITY_DN82183_c0_g1~~TRINITY_DN82183_c0_g1_i1.p1  ORF type:complete len:436 (-),score=89.95 TRINITY_DN82183_c0_g1_i1:7-1281(-)